MSNRCRGLLATVAVLMSAPVCGLAQTAATGKTLAVARMHDVSDVVLLREK